MVKEEKIKQRIKWNNNDVSTLKKYLLKKKEYLIEHLYNNLKEDKTNLKKKKDFFKEMAEATSKTINQCKTRFQKQERNIYIKYLEVDKNVFAWFEYLRDNKSKR